jgi:hypothetical protein
MKLRNTVIVVAAVAMAAMIQTAQAAFSDNLADLIANNGSLTIDDKTFSGFSIFGSGLTSFDAANIMVTASASGGVEYLTWQGNISLVGGGPVTADIILNYTVKSSGGAIDWIDRQCPKRRISRNRRNRVHFPWWRANCRFQPSYGL